MSVVCFNKLLLQNIIYLRGFILGEGFRCTLKSHILIVYLYRVTYPFKVPVYTLQLQECQVTSCSKKV